MITNGSGIDTMRDSFQPLGTSLIAIEGAVSLAAIPSGAAIAVPCTLELKEHRRQIWLTK